MQFIKRMALLFIKGSYFGIRLSHDVLHTLLHEQKGVLEMHSIEITKGATKINETHSS